MSSSSPSVDQPSNSRDARGSKRSSLKLPKTPLSAREETISSRGGPPPPPVDRDRYPNWCVADAPVDAAQVAAIFQFFEYHYGFQHDNVCNIFDYLLTLLDSRAARMAPTQALRTLHADYIGGEHANYRTWYFAAQLDLDLRHTRPASANSDPTASDAARKRRKKKTNATDQLLAQANQEWQAMMVALSDVQRLEQLALFLLIWGEASTLRYMPELLCFIFRLANDRRATLDARSVRGAQPNAFLDTVVTPLYAFARDQSYLLVHGQHIRREKDHNSIIGYDDMNQLFWDRRAIAKLMLKGQSGVILKDIPVEHRYDALPMIDWESAFGKLFYETRSWLHLFTNFARFWVLHMSTFWYYMTANMDFFYIADARRRSPPLPLKLSIVALGGLVAIVLIMLATIAEFKYLPTRSHVTKILAWRLLILALLGAMHVGATFYIVYLDNQSLVALILASCQLGLGAIVTLILAIVPSARLFRFGRSHRHLATQAFTAHFPCLQGDDRFLSVLLWLCVFACKFLETYFFQALSFSEAVETMVTARLTGCRSDPLVKDWLCDVMPWMATILMFMVELLLFFLDTYLWYIIWNTVFSVSQAMRLGISIMTSWRTMFARLPHHMHQKITTATDPLKKMACSQLWNAIIISMYREHLLSISNLQWLMYKVYNKTSASEEDQLDQVSTTSTQHGRTQGTQNMRGLSVPAIFDLRNTQIKKDQCFPAYSEAERRLSFFAQSLASDVPKPYSVPDMPTFTVFTPHYAEKMLLSLREIIREEDSTTRVTLLEYLKRLHHAEWLHFVKDTKVLAEEDEEEEEEQGNLSEDDGDDQTVTAVDHPIRRPPSSRHLSTAIKDKDDLPFYCIGFKSSAPEYTLRTRVWASLRAQTLYRTISGFMNYARALKILHRVEHPELSNIDQPQATEAQLDRLAYHKFRFLVAMQRYSRFTDEENENCEYLLSEFPHLEIAYIEEVPYVHNDDENEEKNASRTEGATFYSCLVDGTCEKLPNGRRKPKCRIRLPGNPILGDGKSDNQNHAIIFARGEYLQLVDANQDNYLEEALKIRSIFREFETTSPSLPSEHKDEENDEESGQNSTLRAEFSMYALSDPRTATPPVAIVGAREYIFSENIGVLGDIAAGKEQTFGTLTQRIMAKAGGRLHYGHPDFLNAVFMTSRGGVSKAQRGLHLNEDIFAGIMAFTRGGRIKHSEYLQCGKGRDLGFCSILNFTTKIGTGMGEQLLSREYYYLGTQLPLDRFLTFYYAHPGFHMNNVMIIFAIQLFLFCMTVVGTIAMAFSPSTCMFCLTQVVTCLDMMPVYDWLRRSILSIFMVFFISFLPLFLQELTEKGTARSVMRLVKQFVSLSPLFEVFVTQIYANAVLSNLSFGGARYIATGRGFATSRLPFVQLYARFANSSIYFGARNMFMLLLVSLLVWFPHLIYFWATVSSLVISPFIFNPHQFVLSEFILDYRRFLYWFIQGNAQQHEENAWITYCRLARIRFTGIKYLQQKERKRKKDVSEPSNGSTSSFFHLPRPQQRQKQQPQQQQQRFSTTSKEFASSASAAAAATTSAHDEPPNVSSTAQLVGHTTSIHPRAKLSSIFFSEILMPLVQAALCVVTYAFFKSRDGTSLGPMGAFGRIGLVVLAPIVIHAVLLVLMQIPILLLSRCSAKSRIRGPLIATLTHCIAMLVVVAVLEYFWWIERYATRSTLLGLLAIFTMQRFIFKTFVAVFITRELPHDDCNRAWWNGHWEKLGRHAMREYMVKIMEMSVFTNDFVLGHAILFFLFPVTWIPFIDRLHSIILFWLRPSKQIRPSILSTRQQQKRTRMVLAYTPLFVLMFLLFASCFVLPILFLKPLTQVYSLPFDRYF